MSKDETYSGQVPGRVLASVTSRYWGSPPDWDHPEELTGEWRVQWIQEHKQTSVIVYTDDGGGQLFIDQADAHITMLLYMGDPDAKEFSYL